MKATLLLTAVQNGARRIPMGLGFALAVTLLQPDATAQDVNLGTANNFAVLAYSAVSSTGNTVITGGNIGLYPDTLSSVTGFNPPGIVNAPGIIEAANGDTLQAKNDLTTAYNQAAGLAPNSNLTGQDLGGLTLTPGVYFFSSSAGLTGQLTLNDLGNPDAVFVFQIGSTLTTASGSSVVTINDPSTPGISVFWQIGSSATLGTGTDFVGNILAQASITDNGGSTVEGRLLAETGAVTLNDTIIDVPPAELIGGGGGVNAPDTGSTLLLLGSGVLSLLAFSKTGDRFLVLTQNHPAIS
jgi:Ice-binding-like